jgi:hypothetical protein
MRWRTENSTLVCAGSMAQVVLPELAVVAGVGVVAVVAVVVIGVSSELAADVVTLLK